MPLRVMSRLTKPVNQKQPNNFSCLVYAYATILGISAKELMILIGHDGAMQIRGIEIGFHSQELLDACMFLDHTPVVIEAHSASILDEGDPYPIRTEEKSVARLEKYMKNHSGVILCRVGFNKPHAVAWHNGEVYDPSVNDFKINQLVIDEFHALYRLA